MRDYIEAAVGVIVGAVGVTGVVLLAVLLTPWFWLAVIAFILATHL